MIAEKASSYTGKALELARSNTKAVLAIGGAVGSGLDRRRSRFHRISVVDRQLKGHRLED